MTSTDGEVSAITPDLLSTMKDSITNMAKQSLRTLCLAYKEIYENENLEASDPNGIFEVEKSGFTMLIIIGVRDVARDEVPSAIADCKKAGITVRMVTGDNLITARAIA